MRFPKFNRVLRCQEESGNVTNVGGPTDISTDIDGKARPQKNSVTLIRESRLLVQ
jgi:hypothetical protein